MQEAPRCINCQGEQPHLLLLNNLLLLTIVSIIAVENISIADAKNHIENGSLTSILFHLSTLLKNNNNFLFLATEEEFEHLKTNTFDLLGVEESEGKFQTYAKILNLILVRNHREIETLFQRGEQHCASTKLDSTQYSIRIRCRNLSPSS